MQRYIANINEQNIEFHVEPGSHGKVFLELAGKKTEFAIQQLSPHEYAVGYKGKSSTVAVTQTPSAMQAFMNGQEIWFKLKDANQIRREQIAASLLATSGDLVAPMPGKVIEVEVKEGDVVKQGQGVVIVEAMKMQNEFKAPVDGIVQAIHVKPGDTIEGGTVMVSISA